MSSMYVPKYRTSETYSALVIFNVGIAALPPGDMVLDKLRTRFTADEERFRRSFAFHEQESLGKKSEEIVAGFGRSFRKLRDMAEILADSELEYPIKAPNAKEVFSILNQHDLKLYTRSKDEIVNIFESIATECEYVEEDSILVLSDTFPLFDTCMKQIHQLKQIEELSAAATLEGDELSTPSDIAKEIKPDLTYIHTHLEKVAAMDEPVYLEVLASIDVHLAPIITRVKARMTRAEHAAAQENSELGE